VAGLIVHSFDPIVLVGGADLGPQDLNIFQSIAPHFVGVDGGANHLLRAGIDPCAVIGDFDSLDQAARDRFGDVLHHIPEQDTVDFEKALSRVTAPLIYAIGFSGGRLDHTLAVLDVMGRMRAQPVVLVGAQDVSAVVPVAGLPLRDLGQGMRLSLMPLGRGRVTAKGLQWPVVGQMMEPLGFSGPSNAVAADTVHIAAEGPVLVVMPRAALPFLAQGLAG